MTTRLRAHFDGKVIVPDEPVNLPTGQQLIVDLRAVTELLHPKGISGRQMLELVKRINWPLEDLAEVKKAIEEDCKQVDHDEW